MSADGEPNATNTLTGDPAMNEKPEEMQTDQPLPPASPERAVSPDSVDSEGEPRPESSTEGKQRIPSPPPVDLNSFDSEETDIDMNHQRIKEIVGFERFRRIKYLGLRWNQIRRIENVSMLRTLVHLELYDNHITKIENLDGLENLEILDLSFNKLTKIENLDALTKLKKLFLCANKIDKIENLDSLKDLEMLELGDNRIRVMENLSALKNLQQLYIGKNRIKKIEGLEGNPLLEILSLQSNRIATLTGLDAVPNLTQLYLSHNGIQKVENLEKNLKLQTLDIASNRIENDLGDLSHMKELEEWWFNGNKISSWKAVEDALKNCPRLSCVYLEMNPLADDPQYRLKLKLMFPKLTQIDATLTSGV
ncbi:unnamed protein product [Cyprideis torosa]|uniref:Dynein axonemal assembly factor 1 homolog n=1 Tax=Cyprideis torosa TaxID=163714 RepID=A0A7R8W9U8_9CRUS|nr:unnamed protein product [Cyprideis torosa]CAG0884674.1 unnamed protein product [Cyprideis torosa]